MGWIPLDNRPTPMFSSGCGLKILGTADQIILNAASTIKPPSIALEKYSALLCPNSCFSSGGFSARFSIIKATTAATRFTHDSNASDNNPTEFVKKYAASFNEIVNTAATIER